MSFVDFLRFLFDADAADLRERTMDVQTYFHVLTVRMSVLGAALLILPATYCHQGLTVLYLLAAVFVIIKLSEEKLLNNYILRPRSVFVFDAKQHIDVEEALDFDSALKCLLKLRKPADGHFRPTNIVVSFLIDLDPCRENCIQMGQKSHWATVSPELSDPCSRFTVFFRPEVDRTLTFAFFCQATHRFMGVFLPRNLLSAGVFPRYFTSSPCLGEPDDLCRPDFPDREDKSNCHFRLTARSNGYVLQHDGSYLAVSKDLLSFSSDVYIYAHADKRSGATNFRVTRVHE